MDSFILRYLLVILIRIFDRTVFYTGSTTGALVLENVPWLLGKCDFKISNVSFYTVNFSIGENLYVRMPADLDQLGCEYSHRAVVGRKRLVKLGHMAADARRFLDQVNLETGSRKVKRGLNTAYPSTNNHHVSKITVCRILARLLHVFS
jgi:hypothetical protein